MPTRFQATPAEQRRGKDALYRSIGITAAMEQHEDARQGLARKRRSLWLKANRAGTTYEEIRKACGVARSAVETEMSLARREANGG